MLPLLTFASGLVAGVVGVRLLKNAKLPERRPAGIDSVGAKGPCALDKAQTTVREAAISGLSAIERTSARVRTKLTVETAEPPAAADPASAEEEPTEETAASTAQTTAAQTTAAP